MTFDPGQPNQLQATETWAAGVLTLTVKCFINHTVAASCVDGSSTNAVVVTEPNSGELKIVVTCTPNSAITTMAGSVAKDFLNTTSPSA